MSEQLENWHIPPDSHNVYGVSYSVPETETTEPWPLAEVQRERPYNPDPELQTRFVNTKEEFDRSFRWVPEVSEELFRRVSGDEVEVSEALGTKLQELYFAAASSFLQDERQDDQGNRYKFIFNAFTREYNGRPLPTVREIRDLCTAIDQRQEFEDQGYITAALLVILNRLAISQKESGQ